MEMPIERTLLLVSSPSNSTHSMDEFEKCREQPTAELFWAIICVVSALLGVPASVMVLRNLCQRRRQGISSDVFMFNLSIMDLTFMVVLLPAVYNYTMLGNQNLYYFSEFIHGLPLCGRPFFMACICGDCYFAVIHPIRYMTNKNGTRIREIICLTVWMITFGFGSVLSMVQNVFISPVVSLPLMLALPVITFCDVSIFQALRSPDPSGKIRVHPKKKRALQIVCTSFTMTFTAYLPPAIMFMFARIFVLYQMDFFCTFSFYGVAFCVVGCVIMPVLYLDNVGKLDHLKVQLKKCISS